MTDDEGVPMRAHPVVVLRDGPTGHRSAIAYGPEVADVIASMIGGDDPVDERRARTADLMGLSLPMVDAAMAYYAEHACETDDRIAERTKAASEAEAA